MSTNKKAHIHWFGNDLRMMDQPFALMANGAQQIIGLYVIDPQRITFNEWGFRNMSLKRLQVLREHLTDLEKQLSDQGAPLIVRLGNPSDIVPSEVQKRNASLSFMKEYATHERSAQSNVLNQLDAEHVFQYDGNFLLHPDSCSWGENFPASFSRFRKQAEKILKHQTYTFDESLACGNENLETRLKESQRGIHEHSALPFRGGTTAGIDRLNAYLFQSKRASTYKKTRNGLLGEAYSTKFSLWLAAGALSPQMIMKALKEYELQEGQNKSTYWIFFELLWRDYFRHACKYFKDQFFAKSGVHNNNWNDQQRAGDFESWRKGITEQDFVNANMVELKETGFMSNRGRQNAASFLVHEQQEDWRKGAAWFEHCLLDYDVYSNHGNWQYVKGVSFNPRGGSRFNCEAQADRYDSDRQFRETWLKK